MKSSVAAAGRASRSIPGRFSLWITQHPLALLIPLLGLAFALRVAYLVGLGQLDEPLSFDEQSYHNLAQSLAAGDGYTSGGKATAFRPPGYPIFVAALYLVFGHSFAIVRLVQAALGAVTLVIVYLIGARLFNPRVGLIAALYGALYPLLIVMTGEIYSEVLLTGLLASLLLFMVLDQQKPRRIYPWLIGLLLGIVALVRPNMLPLVGLFPLCFFAVHPPRRAVTRALTVVSITLLCVVPWTLRNYLVFREWIPLTTQTGVIFWEGNNPAANGSGIAPDPNVWNGPNPPQLGISGWHGLTEQESSDRFIQVALDWMRAHPVQALTLMPLKLRQLWSPLALTMVSERQLPALAERIVPAPYAAFLGLVLVGLIDTRHRWRSLLPFYALILTVNVSALIFFGGTRYALPMAIALFILSAAGTEWLWARRGSPGHIISPGRMNI